MKQPYNFLKNYKLRGLLIYIKLRYQLTTKLKIPNIKYEIFIRKQTSDIATFYQIFGNQEYGEVPIKFSPKTIIDLGANIGLASIFFANKYPNSKILAIEPEESNFKMLKKNTENYKNITLFKNAISNLNGLNVSVQDEGYGKWGFMTKIIDSKLKNEVKTVSIDTLVNDYNISSIDILKIDVEGAEKELFESNFEAWLPITKCIIIEFKLTN